MNEKTTFQYGQFRKNKNRKKKYYMKSRHGYIRLTKQKIR